MTTTLGTAAPRREQRRLERLTRTRAIASAGISTARPGRPRKAQAKREPNGRAQRAPVHETEAKIREIVEAQRRKQAADFVFLSTHGDDRAELLRPERASAAGRLYLQHEHHEKLAGRPDYGIGITKDQFEAAKGFEQAYRNGIRAMEAPGAAPLDMTKFAPVRDPMEVRGMLDLTAAERRDRSLTDMLNDMSKSKAQQLEERDEKRELHWKGLRDSIVRDATYAGLDGRKVLEALTMLCVLDIDLTRPETIKRARKGLGYCWDYFERNRPKKYRNPKSRIVTYFSY